MSTGDAEKQVAAPAEKLCLACGGRYANIARCPKDSTALVPINHDAVVGESVGTHYEILGTIGRGGMSVVYKAKHRLMKRVVALKVLTANDPYSIKRFQLEAQLAANLSHPNIVTVYDFGLAEDTRPYLSMDFVEGRTLSAAIAAEGPMPVHRALPLFIQACDALAYAHGTGVIHRDLKPSNFMLVRINRDERIKLLDFGIAKQLECTEEMQQLTASGQVFGSPLYMSPEQCLGQKLDTRGDIYSLGCVMYEVLSGRPPFVGKSPLDTMQLHVKEDAKPFRQIDPNLNVPRELEHIVLKALERDIKKRYQTTQDILSDLLFYQDQLRSGQSSTSGTNREQLNGAQFGISGSDHTNVTTNSLGTVSDALRNVLGETEPPQNAMNFGSNPHLEAAPRDISGSDSSVIARSAADSAASTSGASSSPNISFDPNSGEIEDVSRTRPSLERINPVEAPFESASQHSINSAAPTDSDTDIASEPQIPIKAIVLIVVALLIAGFGISILGSPH